MRIALPLKDLTKLPISDDANSDPAALANARKASLALGDPHNFRVGVDAWQQVIPQNVIAFSRHAPIKGPVGCHNRHVMILNLQTAGSVVLDDVWFTLEPGSALLILPYQFHHYANFANQQLNWLFVTFDIQNASPLLPLRNRPVQVPPRAYRHADELCQAYLAAQAGDDAARDNTILCAAQLLQCMLAGTTNQPDAAKPATREARRLVREVGQYLEQHLAQPVGIADLAEHLAISESHLRNLFKEQLGISLGKYIRRSKITRASCLIDTSDMTLTQVADACGYTSLYAFSRTFKSEMGVSPSEYREQSRRG